MGPALDEITKMGMVMGDGDGRRGSDGEGVVAEERLTAETADRGDYPAGWGDWGDYPTTGWREQGDCQMGRHDSRRRWETVRERSGDC